MNKGFKISHPNKKLKRIHSIEIKIFLIILFVCFFLVLETPLPFAQENFKSLTLLYSNNINGEIEPCPV